MTKKRVGKGIQKRTSAVRAPTTVNLDLQAVRDVLVGEGSGGGTASPSFREQLHHPSANVRVNACLSLSVLFADAHAVPQLTELLPQLCALSKDVSLDVRASALRGLRSVLENHTRSLDTLLSNGLLLTIAEGFSNTHHALQHTAQQTTSVCEAAGDGSETAEALDTAAEPSVAAQAATSEDASRIALGAYVSEMCLLLSLICESSPDESAAILCAREPFVRGLTEVLDNQGIYEHADTSCRTLVAELLYVLVQGNEAIRAPLSAWAHHCCSRYLMEVFADAPAPSTTVSSSLRYLQVYLLGIVSHVLGSDVLVRTGHFASQLLDVADMEMHYHRVTHLLSVHFDVPLENGSAGEQPHATLASNSDLLEASVRQYTDRLRAMNAFVEILSHVLEECLEKAAAQRGGRPKHAPPFLDFVSSHVGLWRLVTQSTVQVLTIARNIGLCALLHKARYRAPVQTNLEDMARVLYSEHVGDIAQVLEALLSTLTILYCDMVIHFYPGPAVPEVQENVAYCAHLSLRVLLDDLESVLLDPSVSECAVVERYVVPRLEAISRQIACTVSVEESSQHASRSILGKDLVGPRALPPLDYCRMLDVLTRSITAQNVLPASTQCLMTAVCGSLFLLMHQEAPSATPIEMVQKVTAAFLEVLQRKDPNTMLVSWEAANVLIDMYSTEDWDKAVALPMQVFAAMSAFLRDAPRKHPAWDSEEREHVSEIVQNLQSFGKYKASVHKSK